MTDICFVGLGVLRMDLPLEPLPVTYTYTGAVSVQKHFKRCIASAIQHSQAMRCAMRLRLITGESCARKAMTQL